MSAIRLLPIVLFATASLFVLKATGIVTGGGYILKGLTPARAQAVSLPPPQPLDPGSASAPVGPQDITGSIDKTGLPPVTRASAKPEPKRSWAQEMFGYPDITGSVPEAKPPPSAPQQGAQPPAAPPQTPPAAQNGMPPTPSTAGTPVRLEERPALTAGERAVLERLQERRQELEARARELDMREALLKTAEKKLEARLGELKQMETQFGSAAQKKEEAESARLKGVVTMYENMKAKEAARIFERLEPRVLIEVAALISPRRMSEILAQMSPESAQRLTVELATRSSGGNRPIPPEELPKIEGRPRS
jgi:flagellar motility protein MotE (MotC chaperone)